MLLSSLPLVRGCLELLIANMEVSNDSALPDPVVVVALVIQKSLQLFPA